MAPKEQKALVLPSKGADLVVQSATVPSPGPGEILARVDATSLNPADWKFAFADPYRDLLQYPAILGFDAAGVVEEVGEGVTNLKKGDRATSFYLHSLWEGDIKPHRATFQQYALATAEFAAKVPDNVSLDEAASIPATLATAYLGLYSKKKDDRGGGAELTPFWQSSTAYAGQPFVLLGGATSIGQFVIQLARLSGFSSIIVTASEKHAEHLKSLGATHVLSRTLSTDALRVEIGKITSHPIKIVYDAVSVATTQHAAWSLLSTDGELILVQSLAEGIVHGEDGKELVQVSGHPEWADQQEAGRELYARVTQVLQDGSIKPHRVQLLPRGLAGIPEGLELLRQDKVSGVKLIARPQETV
ncbi:GroES-like protein [Punctularia strigosozonata HHB-11173 SS5]|uniref:GroES-like protein n=1 Tax=Punctularia strigosozonata (strain HHB-11173) TaxID=741275 RepID=UPI0004416634|nr:GroES-like protein [Punctularia strigosozonata HHB-11173 SS5]EIN12420.1 GroES-like protein [Punctularia strigosozonata HHB-11173 SS5]